MVVIGKEHVSHVYKENQGNLLMSYPDSHSIKYQNLILTDVVHRSYL